MQIVPAMAGVAEKVTVFQRSPQWAVPHPTYREPVADDMRQVMTHVPFYVNWFRLRQFWAFGDRLHPLLQIDPEWSPGDRSINRANEAFRKFLTRHIEQQLDGRPDLLEKSLPTYPPYGKRMLLDNAWFETIRRDDVYLETDAVSVIREDSIVTAAGEEHPVDVIVLATGFKALDPLGHIEVRGRAGQLLSDLWSDDDARAHLGVSIPGFPNFFCLYGPNTNTGHGGTVVLTTEVQVRYVMQLIARMLRDDIAAVECRQDVFDAYNAKLDDALARTVWTHTGTTTYYRNRQGRIVANSPWKYLDYWTLTRTPDPDDFDLVPETEQTAVGDR
jgi:4-hydroxyacetophenone monooxygenase